MVSKNLCNGALRTMDDHLRSFPVYLVDGDTKKLLKHYRFDGVPQVGDIILLDESRYEVVQIDREWDLNTFMRKLDLLISIFLKRLDENRSN